MKKAKIHNMIWLKFLKTEEPVFKKHMGYGKEEISRIGADKFIRRMGWETVEDVKRWRTNVLALVICPHCKNDFGALDDFGAGLCKECFQKYDMRTFHLAITHAAKFGKGDALLGMFFGQEFYRQMYSADPEIRQNARDNFKENLTKYMYDKYFAAVKTEDPDLAFHMKAKEEEIKRKLEADISDIISFSLQKGFPGEKDGKENESG